LFNIPINNCNQVANATSLNAMLRFLWRACGLRGARVSTNSLFLWI